MLPLITRLSELLRTAPEAALALAARWAGAFEALHLHRPDGIEPEDTPPPFY